jgi:hypothetical protein
VRPRRFLLVTSALSSASLVAACKKEPLPTEPPVANPKATFYDAGAAPPPPIAANPKGSQYALPRPADAGDDGPSANPLPPPIVRGDAGAAPLTPKMPANPKGSHYDDPWKKK